MQGSTSTGTKQLNLLKRRMLGDVWAWDLVDEKWMKVVVNNDSGDVDGYPANRGWFAADVRSESEFVVHGGLDEGNERLGDVWVGRVTIE